MQPKLPRSLPHPLSVDDVARLLEAPDTSTLVGLRDRAILEVLYGAGLRISELVGLDVDDVDLEDGYVRVLGKGGKEREVPFGTFARDAVSTYLTRARPAFASKASRAALFLNQRGGRLDPPELHPAARRGGASSPGSIAASRSTRCGIRSPPTCSREERTSGWCRSCSVTRASPPRRSTRW